MRLHAEILLHLALILLVFSMMPGTAARAGELSIALDASFDMPQGEFDDRYGNELGPNLSLEYMYNDYVGFFVAAGYHHFNRPNDGKDISLLDLNLNAQVAYPFLEKWRVFSSLGMGLYTWEADSAWWKGGEPDESSDIGFNFGGGVNYQIFDWMDVITSVYHHSVKFEDHDDAFEWNEIRAGFRFVLTYAKTSWLHK